MASDYQYYLNFIFDMMVRIF